MRKYTYENATVYITKPTEEQIENIHKATERFAKKLVKKGVIFDGRSRSNHRRSSRSNSKTRQRAKETQRKDKTNNAIYRDL